MSTIRDRFDGLTAEQRVFWLQTAGAPEHNGRHAQIAIDTWENHHGMSHERATLEAIAWLIIARESLGIEGYVMRSSRGTFTPTPSTVDGEPQRAHRMNAIDYA